MGHLVEEVAEYAFKFLKDNLSTKLHFHNLAHTCNVVQAAKEIGLHCNLPAREMTTLTVAAWFHDCGYAHTYIGHEEDSKKEATTYLEKTNCGPVFIRSVLDCIEATKFPQNPKSAVERVLCDADMYHFTKVSYPQYAKAIRSEFETYLLRTYTDEEWLALNCNLLKTHRYHTDYGQAVLNRFKEINIQLMDCGA